MTLREERKEAGLCVHCGKPTRTGRVSCVDCAKKVSENYYYRKALWTRRGLCPRCGNAIEDTTFKTCERCRRNARNHMRNTKNRSEVMA